MNNFTPQFDGASVDPNILQALAADPEANVFVAASAGTGKTKVLTDRYLRLLLAGNPAPNILCITYTKAAAHEMLSRIKKSLKAWFLADNAALQKQLTQLLQRPPAALEMQSARRLYFELIEQEPQLKIQTLHAFCLQLLQRFPPNERLRGGVNIVTDEQKRALLELAFKQVLPKNEAAIKRLAEIYDGRNLWAKISDLFQPTARLRRYMAQFVEDPNFSQIYTEYGAKIDVTADDITAVCIQQISTPELKTAIAELNAAGAKDADKLMAWQQMDATDKQQNFAIFYGFFLTKEDEPRKNLINKKIQAQYPEMLPLFTKIAAELVVYREVWRAQMTATYFTALLAITRDILEQYTNKCQAQGLFEYEDLIDEVINLLSTSQNAHWILYRLDMQINHVLVDEAQDISPRQWAVLSLLTDDFFAGLSARTLNRTIFIVGDYKQSIYGFQGANPDYFAQMCRAYAQKVQDAGKIWREIQLVTSFRSVGTVLEFVDNVFNGNGIRLETQVAQLKHIPFRAGQGLIVTQPLAEVIEQEVEEGWKLPQAEVSATDSRRQQIAESIADTIADWLQQKRVLAGHQRVIQAGDILILLRKRGDLQKMLVEALKRRQIAVADADRFQLTQHILVQDFIALGNFLLLPADDMNLAILLRSPICGISEDQLFALAHDRQCSLWQSVQEKEPEIANYLQHLRKLLTQSKISIYDILAQVLYVDGKLASFIAEIGEFAREVAVDLARIVLEYEQQHGSDLQKFIAWLRTANINLKSSQSAARDAVRVMTIHTAKGLQAPVVIMADAASSEQSPYEGLYWLEDKLYFSIYKEYDTVHITAAKRLSQELAQQENNRLLYVALTRAEDELHIYGWANNRDKNSWYALLNAAHQNFSTLAPQPMPMQENAVADALYVERKLPSYFLNAAFDISRQQIELVKPSRKAAGQHIKQSNFIRGQVIHNLLFMLPQAPESQWDDIIAAAIHAKGLAEHDCGINKVVRAVISKFPELFFASNVLSEVSIATNLYGQRITAQIDKLIINADNLKIIDFKTDAEHVGDHNIANQDYSRQMAIYRKIVAIKYPSHQIIAQILWTENQEVTTIY